VPRALLPPPCRPSKASRCEPCRRPLRRPWWGTQVRQAGRFKTAAGVGFGVGHSRSPPHRRRRRRLWALRRRRAHIACARSACPRSPTGTLSISASTQGTSRSSCRGACKNTPPRAFWLLFFFFRTRCFSTELSSAQIAKLTSEPTKPQVPPLLPRARRCRALGGFLGLLQARQPRPCRSHGAPPEAGNGRRGQDAQRRASAQARKGAKGLVLCRFLFLPSVFSLV